MIAALLSVSVLLIVSALLNASLASVERVSASNLRTLLEEGFGGAEALAEAREHDWVATGATLLANIFELAALGVIALTGVSTWGTSTPAVNTAVGVLIVILVAEILPRAVAAKSPVRIALRSASTLLRVSALMKPISKPLSRLEERIGSHDEAVDSDHRELLEIQEIGEEEGVLEPAESLLVERAFRLDELTAWDVMIPRVDIFSWKEELTLEEVVADLAEVPYSRVPVYKESVDDVTGIVYVREVYERFSRGERDTSLGSIAREPFFVPGSLSLTQLLRDFQARRIHLGIVADEFGGTDGLVTLEDVLEELVGEIRDETDVEEDEIVRVSDDVVECDAGVDLRDLVEEAGFALPKGEQRSLNGFILEELGHVPTVGEVVETTGVRIDILDSTETQVLRARLTRVEAPEVVD